MVNAPALAIPVTETSQIAEARRAATSTATQLGLNETDTGRAAIVATELASNLIKHAGGGEILVTPLDDQTSAGLQLIALDKGPGMADFDRCMQDGYSTAGSAGSGLGAIFRQSHVFDVFTRPGGGTAVLAEIRPGRPPTSPPSASQALAGGLAVPIHGETECGDSWAIRHHGGSTTMLVADGLGHGPAAATASRAAVGIFTTHHALSLQDLAGRIHEALRATRGAAMAVARITPARHTVDYVGIGNISGTLVTPSGIRKMVSHNGTAGLVARKIQLFSYDYQGQPLVIMHSDGLATSWSLDHYPSLATHHVTLIAAVLYRDFTRRRDDVSVIAVRAAP